MEVQEITMFQKVVLVQQSHQRKRCRWIALNQHHKSEDSKSEPKTSQKNKSPSTKKQLEQDLFMARQFKIDSVPYFIFAEQYAVAGAHMPEHFLPVIDAAAAL